MKYDFETVYERIDSIACECCPIENVTTKDGFDKIPMWIADMAFATCPSVTQAIKHRLEHGIFGYFNNSDEYYNAIINWQAAHNGVSGLEKEHISYENGVLGGLASALTVLCEQGASVLIHSPTYIGFTNTLKGRGYNIVSSPLVKDENGIARMDFEDMERKICENNIHTAVFCSPHNPSGRVWEKWEIERAMELFKKHNVYVISDEIWADLTFADHRHVPTQSVSDDAKDRTVALYAPSKTFNIAGLVSSYRITYNPYLRKRIDKAGELTHYNHMNVLSMHALIGAYTKEGEEWLDELREVLYANVKYVCQFVKENFDGVEVSESQGTYIMFLDCTKWCEKHGVSIDELLRRGVEVGVIWQDGRCFGGACHVRMNIALPMSKLEEAFARLKKYVFV